MKTAWRRIAAGVALGLTAAVAGTAQAAPLPVSATGERLFGRNAQQMFVPGSITKVTGDTRRETQRVGLVVVAAAVRIGERAVRPVTKAEAEVA